MNKKLKVLFINFPTFTPSSVEACFKATPTTYLMQVPLGIAHLASVLEIQEFIESVECLDYCAELENGPKYGSYEVFIDTLAKEISYEPDIIAYSMNFSTQHDFFVRCEERLKPLWPNSIMIAGGAHATNITKDLFEQSEVDFIVRGEAEDAIVKMLDLIAAGKTDQASSIQGIYCRETIQDDQPLKICEYPDLEQLPTPCWHIFDMPRYVEKYSETFVHADRRNSCSIMTSRGCPFHCTFCSSFTLHGRKMRYFGPEWTKKAVMELYDTYGVTEFVIQDDMFTVHRERTVEMLTELQSLPVPDMALSVKNALSVNTLDDSVIDALAATGLETAYIAVESGSEHVNHNIMKKRVKLDKVPGIIEKFRERGVPTCCFFIMGFPGETREMMDEGIAFAESINSDWCTFNAVKPLVGTPLYDEMLAEGYIDHTPEYWAQTAYGLREFDTKEIDKEELNDLLYDANIRINFLKNYNVRSGNYDVAAKMFKNIVEDYPYHIIAWYMLHVCAKETGDLDQSSAYLIKIQKLLETDERATGMYLKYGSQLPDLKGLDVKLRQGDADFRVNASTSISQQLDADMEVASE